MTGNPEVVTGASRRVVPGKFALPVKSVLGRCEGYQSCPAREGYLLLDGKKLDPVF